MKIQVKGARENNLNDINVVINDGLTVVTGISGSGKSSLIVDTLGRIIVPKKQTTSVAYEPIEPGKYKSLEGTISKAMIIDQSRKQVYSPLNFFGLKKTFFKIFAESDDAKHLDLDEKQISNPCSACKGRGTVKTDMGFLPDIHNNCEICKGSGLVSEVRDIRVHGYTLPDLYKLTLNQIFKIFKSDKKISQTLNAAINVGLGYLLLNQPGYTLSGGECQRMKIAKEISRKKSGKISMLYILDEPTIGQHLEDIDRLIGVLNTLVDEGNSVIIIEHHPHMLASCDWLIELGSVGGSQGGYIVASGTPKSFVNNATPTAHYLRHVLEVET